MPKRLAAVERLRTQVATLPLTLDVEGVADVRREREDLLSQLDDYILPRLQRPDAPALAVIGGSTGAGKSTLTNSIVGREVTRSGVLRPTTRSPVLVHHPIDSGAFLSQRILPRLTRVTSEAPEPVQPIDPNAPRITGLRLVPYDGLAPGLALLDAPDIDSLVETNRDLAVQLLQAADLWVFVTTAARYADATPWKMLRQAAERGAAIAVVLDRVPPESLQELRIHLATKLRDQGLGGAALFTVPESPLENGFLPPASVKPLRDWLRRIAGDARSRSVVIERTLKGALRSLPPRARLLAKAAAAQADGWSQLWEETDEVFIPARSRMLEGLADGSLMSGQVLSHWQEFIARGDLASRLGGVTTTRTQRIGAALSQAEESEEPLAATICEAVSASVHHSVRTAMEQVVVTWRKHPYGVGLLTARGHQVTPTDRENLLGRPVDEWRRGVTEQVTEALNKVRQERPDVSVDEQTVVDVMFTVTVAPDHDATSVSSPAGGTGAVGEQADPSTEGTGPAAEPEDVPAGSTVGARLAVEELLGAETVRAIVDAARADLLERAGSVMENERLRLERVLESPEGLGLRVGGLLDAASAVNIAE
ncbi:dynamin family protein [Kineosporia sp. NBRC 101677]|uniref:dynamin family protein n=1 Tax=Kineosporia sp. NBRC 101677 TaxID=3032197 RepID=UPI002555907F|nr:dynamin family protein [Kineosporia sp. NBRC 101677]